MKITENICPKCKEDNFDVVDEYNFDLDGSSDREFKCLECGCEWVRGVYSQYTDDYDLIEESV